MSRRVGPEEGSGWRWAVVPAEALKAWRPAPFSWELGRQFHRPGSSGLHVVGIVLKLLIFFLSIFLCLFFFFPVFATI